MNFVLENIKLPIAKKYYEGIEVEIDVNAQDFPNAYKYTPESTIFCAVYKNRNWHITNIRRDTCKRPKEKITLVLPSETKQAIIRFYEHM